MIDPDLKAMLERIEAKLDLILKRQSDIGPTKEIVWLSLQSPDVDPGRAK